MPRESKVPSDAERCAEAARTCACFHVRMAARSVTRLFDEALQPAGLRSTQFVLLAAIRAMDEVTLPRLAAAVSLDRSALTRALRPLEASDWVKLTPGPKGRATTATLTAAGRRVVSKAIPLWEAAQARLVEALSPASWDALRQDFDGVAAAADRLLTS
ncbi:MAG: MarR family winged helix-turn-helix transcriptional regulator [Planctomycetota bacterium]